MALSNTTILSANSCRRTITTKKKTGLVEDSEDTKKQKERFNDYLNTNRSCPVLFRKSSSRPLIAERAQFAQNFGAADQQAQLLVSGQ